MDRSKTRYARGGARAKIVCTLGPSTSTPETIRALVDAGMSVARLNMSHGSHEEHRAAYEMVRRASDETGHAVAVLADLQGPKIRLETFADDEVVLEEGARFTITTREVEGDAEQCGTTYAGLPGDVSAGDPILINDGKVRLKVLEVDGDDVHTEVVVGGPVSDHKGINLPGVAVSVPALSEKDEDDLRFALRMSVDFVALSFVRRASDVDRVREIMDEEGVRLPVVAKIEKPEAIDNLDEVVKAFDAFMVARGDLGVECPLEDVPFLQKRVIERARRNAKPVIVATQMLESMISNPAPTRSATSAAALAITPPRVRGCQSMAAMLWSSWPSVESMMRVMVSTVSTGYFPTLVSPDSMSASAPSSTAFAASDASARVGREFSIKDSST